MYRFLEIEYTKHIGQRPGDVWFFIVWYKYAGLRAALSKRAADLKRAAVCL